MDESNEFGSDYWAGDSYEGTSMRRSEALRVLPSERTPTDVLVERLLEYHARLINLESHTDRLMRDVYESKGRQRESEAQLKRYADLHENQRAEIARLQSEERQGRFTREEREYLDDSNLWAHALRELQRAGFYEDDPDHLYGKMLPEAVMEIVGVFALQGHSGMSGSIVLDLLNRLLNFKELSPLTEDMEEWREVSERNGASMYQNRRNSSVFASDPTDRSTWYDIDDRSRSFTEEDASEPEEGAGDCGPECGCDGVDRSGDGES